MVLEKAYAKLHHNWDAIDGGLAGQAVKDMTGGVMQMLDLYGVLVQDFSGWSKKKKNIFFPQQRKLMGSSAQISSGVCRCGSQRQVPEGSGEFLRVLV